MTALIPENQWAEERLADVEEYIAKIDRRADALRARALDATDPGQANARWAVEYDATKRKEWAVERKNLLQKLGRES